jgi:drug/metabolite transporter (DMT)-like permease
VQWAVGAGVLLALHFATWVPSLRYTSVASATAIVATQPVWVALHARAMGHEVPRRAWLGIAISLIAVVVLTGVDFSLDAEALVGDLLALLGGVFGALYTVAGAEVRRTVSTTSYTALATRRPPSPCSSPVFLAGSSSAASAGQPGCSCSP